MARSKLSAMFFASEDGTVVVRATRLSQKIRLAVFREDGLVCRACGSRVRVFGRNYSTAFDKDSSPKGHIDHIFPIARGGQNNRENLRVLCQSCNESKGAD